MVLANQTLLSIEEKQMNSSLDFLHSTAHLKQLFPYTWLSLNIYCVLIHKVFAIVSATAKQGLTHYPSQPAQTLFNLHLLCEGPTSLKQRAQVHLSEIASYYPQVNAVVCVRT